MMHRNIVLLKKDYLNAVIFSSPVISLPRIWYELQCRTEIQMRVAQASDSVKANPDKEIKDLHVPFFNTWHRLQEVKTQKLKEKSILNDIKRSIVLLQRISGKGSYSIYENRKEKDMAPSYPIIGTSFSYIE